MRHFKSQDGQINAIDSGQEFLVEDTWTELSAEELALELNPPETQEQTAARLLRAVESHMDTTAKGKGYDTRYTCAIRAGYQNPWQVEGQVFGEWMDSCYSYCYQVQADVIGGLRTIPTESELIAELPVLTWP